MLKKLKPRNPRNRLLKVKYILFVLVYVVCGDIYGQRKFNSIDSIFVYLYPYADRFGSHSCIVNEPGYFDRYIADDINFQDNKIMIKDSITIFKITTLLENLKLSHEGASCDIWGRIIFYTRYFGPKKMCFSSSCYEYGNIVLKDPDNELMNFFRVLLKMP